MSEAEWRSHVHGLLVDREQRILLIPSEHGWALPSAELGIFSDDDLGHAQRAFEKLLGTPVAILRYVARNVDREQRVLEVVDMLERLDAEWTPPSGAAWVNRESLSGLPLANEEHREVLLGVLEEYERGAVPAERAPWAREGWFTEARSWIDDALAAIGRSGADRVEQVRVWSLSCVLRALTADGAVFFKATAGSPLFVDEGAVMTGLAALFRDNVPAPLAVDAERRFMLLDDFGPELGWNAPIEVREKVFGGFAHMQVESTRLVDELLAIGCVDRRPAWLAAQAAELLDDDLALEALDEAEAERFRALEPWLVTLCAILAAGGVPDALVHGDLHLSNAAERSGRYVFFDWTDACVTHPFLDLIDVVFEADDAVRSSIRDAYLVHWLDFEPLDRLLELWAIAEPLISLNQAVSYRHILANVEPGTTDTLDWALPFFVRKILAIAPTPG